VRRRSDREIVEYLRRLHEEDVERIGRLPGEEKVKLMMAMSDAMVQACKDGIRAQYPNISEEELMDKLRERLEWSKRWRSRSV
jgi:hypothetical protein